MIDVLSLFRSRQPNYMIKCDYLEEQIAWDVSNYMGFLSLGSTHFKLIAENEILTGADARFDCAIPIYLQFKVPIGLKSIHEVTPSNRKNRSSLEDIRIFRAEEGMLDDPTLCFQLREKAKHAIDFQHNILKRHNIIGFSHAFYVVPLSLKKQEYESSLFESTHRYSLPFPFVYRDNQTIRTLNSSINQMGTIPFLRQHISIVPHFEVDTYHHHYSFSTTGSDIAWHSKGERIPLKYSRLSDTLQIIFSDAFIYNGGWSDFDYINAQLNVLREKIGLNTSPQKQANSLTNILEYGNVLYRHYNIKQILVLSSRKFLDSINRD